MAKGREGRLVCEVVVEGFRRRGWDRVFVVRWRTLGLGGRWRGDGEVMILEHNNKVSTLHRQSCTHLSITIINDAFCSAIINRLAGSLYRMPDEKISRFVVLIPGITRKYLV